MNKKWDGNKGGRDLWIAWLADRLREARRVLKPGHYALVWALPRTSHYTGMACEEAGFTVCDRIAFLFGSGFPKGKNKLKPAVEEWWLIRSPGPAAALHIDACRVGTNEDWQDSGAPNGGVSVRDYGDGLNNAGRSGSHSLGRWPPHLLIQHSSGCIPNGVKRVRGAGWRDDDESHSSLFGYGKRTLNGRHYADADGRETVNDWICQDGCPVRELGEMSGESVSRPDNRDELKLVGAGGLYGAGSHRNPNDLRDTGTAARFYPNLDPPEWECEPGCPVFELDQMSGELTTGKPTAGTRPSTLNAYGEYSARSLNGGGDTGGASRYYPNLDPPFFYAAKSSRRERNRGCDSLYWLADDTHGSGYRRVERAEYEAAQEAGERVARGNMHPCVKNIKLLSWLINLLTVPGDVVLDPFAGSGSIGVAALMGGREFVGVEMDEDYLAIAEHRLAHAAEQPRQMEIAV